MVEDIKKRDILKVIFERSLAEDIVAQMGYRTENKVCQFCAIHITKDNVGGFNQSGAICDNFVCISAFVNSLQSKK